MTIVDTSSWIEALRERGDPNIRARVENLLDAGDAAWCQMIRLELWRGVRSGAERRALEFLEPRINVLEINDAVWEASIRLVTKARSVGLTVPSPDALIVATAQYHQARLEHCDQHMDQLLKLV
jgi:predicted nucleic acid-binding protein